MSRSKPQSMKMTRAQYQILSTRADYLGILGSGADDIINEFQNNAIAKKSIKGLNAYLLEQHVMKYSDRLFHAEKRIIKECHPDEWQRDDRLKCISAAMRLQEMAASRNYSVGLKPGKFVVELGSIKIEVEYVDEQIVDVTRIIQLWSSVDAKD